MIFDMSVLQGLGRTGGGGAGSRRGGLRRPPRLPVRPDAPGIERKLRVALGAPARRTPRARGKAAIGCRAVSPVPRPQPVYAHTARDDADRLRPPDSALPGVAGRPGPPGRPPRRSPCACGPRSRALQRGESGAPNPRTIAPTAGGRSRRSPVARAGERLRPVPSPGPIVRALRGFVWAAPPKPAGGESPTRSVPF